jgi:drug/metabolite transporter (DMT)-like permease
MTAPVESTPARRLVTPATVVQFVLLTLIWGSTWLVIKYQIVGVPIAWSVTYRFSIAGVAMLTYCLVMRRPLRLGTGGHTLAAGAALLQFVANFNLVYQSERFVTSGLVALVFSLLIVPNTLFSRIFLGSPISGRFVLGSVMGIAGLVMLVGPDLGLNGGTTMIGLGLAVAGMLSASVANVMQASERVRSLSLEAFLTTALLYGGLFNAVFAFVTTGPPTASTQPSYVLGVLYLGLVASALAFRLYYALIRNIGPARAGYVNVIVPVVAMTLSTVFEAYVWTPLAVCGGVLALAGLVIALRSRA